MKKIIKKITLRDGEYALMSKSGRVVTIPKGIKTFAPPLDFVDLVKKLVTAATKDLHECFVRDVVQPGGVWYRVIYYVTKIHVYWVLERADVHAHDESIGWGVYERKDGNIVEHRAAIDPRFHGMGLYTLVLKEIRRWAKKRPLLSDKIMSYENILVWSKSGKFSTKRGRYKHNPPYIAQDYKKAVFAFYNRAYTD